MPFRLAVLALLLCSPIFARARASSYCAQGGQVAITNTIPSTTKLQQSYPQCSITVLVSGGAKGFVTTSGTTVTFSTGTLFNANSGWPGLIITINAVPYTISSVTSPYVLVLTASAGTQAIPVAYSMPATAPAAIYSNNTGTALANPFTATTTGYWGFYADNGTYDVSANGGGLPTPVTWGAISVIDPLSLAQTVSSRYYQAMGFTFYQACADAFARGLVLLDDVPWYAVGTGTCAANVTGGYPQGVVQPAATKVVTFTGSVLCPVLTQCFDARLGGAGSILLPSGSTVTPYNFGATPGDSDPNSTNYLSAAYAIAAVSSNPTGGTYYIPAGTLSETEHTVMPANVEGKGDGIGISVIHETTAPACGTTSNGSTTWDVVDMTGSHSRLHDLTLKGPTSSGPPLCAAAQSQKGIVIEPASGSITDIRIWNVEVENTVSNCAQTWANVSYAYWENVKFHDCGGEGHYNTITAWGTVLDHVEAYNVPSWGFDTNEGRYWLLNYTCHEVGSIGVFYDGGCGTMTWYAGMLYPTQFRMLGGKVYGNNVAGTLVALVPPTVASGVTMTDLIIDGLQCDSQNLTNNETCLISSTGGGTNQGFIEGFSINNVQGSNTNASLQNMGYGTISNSTFRQNLSDTSGDDGLTINTAVGYIQVVNTVTTGWSGNGVNFQACPYCSTTGVTATGNTLNGINAGAVTGSYSSKGDNVLANGEPGLAVVRGISTVNGLVGSNSLNGGGGYAGTVNTSGTAVTWVSGPYFNSQFTGTLYLGTSPYLISSVNSPTSITLTTSAGSQSGILYFFSNGGDVFASSLPQSPQTSQGSTNAYGGGTFWTLFDAPDSGCGASGYNIGNPIANGARVVCGGSGNVSVMIQNGGTGTVNTSSSGDTVTWETGDHFNTGWTGSITINGLSYTISSCTSTTACTVTTSPGNQTGVVYSFYQFIPAPVLASNLILSPQATPADNATCTAGTFWADTGYIYVCTASGTVKRAALSTY